MLRCVESTVVYVRAHTHPHWRTVADARAGSHTRTMETRLLLQMTLEEKVAQLIHVWGTVKDNDLLRIYGNTSVGAMYSSGLSANDTCNAIVRCRTEVRACVSRSVQIACTTHS